MKSRLEQVDSTNLRKCGGTTTYGSNGFNNEMLNYDLRSWDGGQNWYAVEVNTKTNPWSIKILGEAEKVYPGLLKHLEAWDAMTKRAMEKGPLDFSNPEDAKVLNEAGFTAVKK